MTAAEIDVDTATLEQLRDVLVNESGASSLALRFRALFNLKSIGEEFAADAERANTAVDYIALAFADDSELLKHEVAYVMGQSKNKHAAPALRKVLGDVKQQCMVRHEAAEALGALVDVESLPLLQEYFQNDPLIEIRQTCELAIAKIHYETSAEFRLENLETSAYTSVDPAPPLSVDIDYKIEKLQHILNDQEKPLFERYRAMFRLRDISTDEAALALATGFADSSALFKHEIAYVFGQMCNPVTVPALVKVLRDTTEAGMVRHEAAEALGAIGTGEVTAILEGFLNDEDDVVRESAIVALDME